jgi:hypothetical protein
LRSHQPVQYCGILHHSFPPFLYHRPHCARRTPRPNIHPNSDV